MKRTNLITVLCITVLMCLFSSVDVNAKSKQTTQKKGETTTTFSVPMDCHKCVVDIEKNIAWEKGVTDLKCDFTTKTVKVTYKIAKTNDENIIKAFNKIHKDAKVITTKEE